MTVVNGYVPPVESSWRMKPTGVSPNGIDMTTAVATPARAVVRIRIGMPGPVRVALAAVRPERPPDRDDRDERHEDPELRLDHRGDDRVDRRALRPVAPELAQPEEQEHDAERVDLAPDDAVEPADRVEDREQRPAEREAPAAAELEDHRVDELADGEVGEDRRDLDEVADATGRAWPTMPDEPQHVHVAGHVVVEEVAVVEAPRPVRREVVRPEVGTRPGRP